MAEMTDHTKEELHQIVESAVANIALGNDMLEIAEDTENRLLDWHTKQLKAYADEVAGLAESLYFLPEDTTELGEDRFENIQAVPVTKLKELNTKRGEE